MRKVKMNELTEHINKNKNKVNKIMIETMPNERITRTRPRDEIESKILGMLCKSNWEKAVKEGKVKYITKRKWYYEFD